MCTPSNSHPPPSSPPKSIEIEIKELEVDSDHLGALSVSSILSDARAVCLYPFEDRDNLQNEALLALAALSSEESSAGGRFKHLTHTVVGLGRAFEILVGADLLADFLTLLIG